MTDITLRRYHLGTEDGLSGWGTFVIGSDGYFSAVTDYGNYAFAWRNTGRPDFRMFLTEIGPDYLASKIRPGPMEFDGEATTKAIREYIIEVRRDGNITAELAREEWNHAGWMVHENDFRDWMEATTFQDAHEFSCERQPADVSAFCKRLFPRFKEVLLAELASERSAEVRT